MLGTCPANGNFSSTSGSESYRITCGYGTEDGAIHSVSLWVAYYNFLRPHEKSGGKEPLNKVELLEGAGNMPGKWQLLIYLGQQVMR